MALFGDAIFTELMDAVNVAEESLECLLLSEDTEHSEVLHHDITTLLDVLLTGLVVVHCAVFSIGEAVILLEL